MGNARIPVVIGDFVGQTAFVAAGHGRKHRPFIGWQIAGNIRGELRLEAAQGIPETIALPHKFRAFPIFRLQIHPVCQTGIEIFVLFQ